MLKNFDNLNHVWQFLAILTLSMTMTILFLETCDMWDTDTDTDNWIHDNLCDLTIKSDTAWTAFAILAMFSSFDFDCLEEIYLPLGQVEDGTHSFFVSLSFRRFNFSSYENGLPWGDTSAAWTSWGWCPCESLFQTFAQSHSSQTPHRPMKTFQNFWINICVEHYRWFKNA